MLASTLARRCAFGFLVGVGCAGIFPMSRFFASALGVFILSALFFGLGRLRNFAVPVCVIAAFSVGGIYVQWRKDLKLQAPEIAGITAVSGEVRGVEVFPR